MTEKQTSWVAALKIPEMVIAGSLLLAAIFGYANLQFRVTAVETTVAEMRSHDIPGRVQKLEDDKAPTSQATSAHFQALQDSIASLQSSQQQALNAQQQQTQAAINALQTQQHEEAAAINAISVQIAGIAQQIAYVISQVSPDGKRSR